MSILITCKSCGKRIQAPDKLKGQKVRCPKCSAAIVVEGQPEQQTATAEASPGDPTPTVATPADEYENDPMAALAAALGQRVSQPAESPADEAGPPLIEEPSPEAPEQPSVAAEPAKPAPAPAKPAPAKPAPAKPAPAAPAAQKEAAPVKPVPAKPAPAPAAKPAPAPVAKPEPAKPVKPVAPARQETPNQPQQAPTAPRPPMAAVVPPTPLSTSQVTPTTLEQAQTDDRGEDEIAAAPVGMQTPSGLPVRRSSPASTQWQRTLGGLARVSGIVLGVLALGLGVAALVLLSMEGRLQLAIGSFFLMLIISVALILSGIVLRSVLLMMADVTDNQRRQQALLDELVSRMD